jgi:hypothetical protein
MEVSMPVSMSLTKQDLIVDVVETLQLSGGVVPDTDDQFWLELAAALNLSPKSKDPSRVAQAVLTELEVEWDDEFIGDQGELTLGLYETLDDAVKRFVTARDTGEPIEEEEDDESLAGHWDERVAPVTYGLETVYQWIRDGILVLSPDWQRDFVWKSKKMKRFVESILLGLPIPSFLIFEDSKSGKKYVIDGRQRLETIARFKAPREARGTPRLRFKTFSKKEPGWHIGEQLGDAAGRYYENLEQRFKTRFDSAPLVIAEFRDIPLPNLYQVFKRYNTGAVALNAAEIRNAVYQASQLHQMLFRLSGEQRPRGHVDDEEKRVADDLRETMQRKVQRYGAYDFIGRYFAFAYAERGSVAKATLEFMDLFEGESDVRIEGLRSEFIRVFRTAMSWYEGFLTDPEGGRFHAFLGTLQLVSTKFLLERVDAGLVTSDRVKSSISSQWNAFAQNRLAKKQNSTLFWGSQKTWVSQLESDIGLPRKYESWDWKADLEEPGDRVVG